MAEVVHVYSFEESALVNDLTELSARARMAFAAATATRQLGSYERFADKVGKAGGPQPREAVDQLWLALRSGAIDHDAWAVTLESILRLLPDEEDDWTVGHALADDAISSLAYAIRCLLTSAPQEAAWAGRRAYEAADQAAIRVLGIDVGTPRAEETIRSHEYVQRELERQNKDLVLLRSEAIDEVRRRALKMELLTEEEMAYLI